MARITDCPVDCISIPLPAMSRDSGSSHISESINVDLLGNPLTDMLSFQFHSPSSRHACHEKVSLGIQDIIEFSEQSSRSTFLQLLEENHENIDELQSFDPFHLKFPTLEEQPQEEDNPAKTVASTARFVEKISSYNTTTSNPKKPVIIETDREIQTPRSNFEIKDVLPHRVSPKIEEVCLKSNPLVAPDHEADQSGNDCEKPPEISVRVAAASTDILLCGGPCQSSSGTDTQSKPKRKRAKSCKSSDEVESQRQTHIAVERNRRKQMNEHLSILRSLMPGSYVQRGDQASIVGGAIEFVKELEQLLECLQAQKRRRTYAEAFSPKPNLLLKPALPFYNPVRLDPSQCYSPLPADSKYVNDNFFETMRKEVCAESKSELAEVEVKVVGAEAFLKILSQRRPGQLLKTIAALENLSLTILHTNITTIEQTVLYSFSVTLGAECNLSVDEIAKAVQHIFTVIHNSSSNI